MHDKTETSDPTDREMIIDSIIAHIHHLGKLSLEELEHILNCLSINDGPSNARKNRRFESEEI